MSFRCEHTGETVGPGIPEHRVVVKTRHTTYENYVYKRKKPTKYIRIDQGTEIVKEISVSPDAYRTLTGLEPDKATKSLKALQILEEKKETKPTQPWKNKKHKQNSKKPIIERVTKQIRK